MVDDTVTIYSDAGALRQRAERCRLMAREYHPSVGAPLIELAVRFEREAADKERGGVERRGLALLG
jgi:hypothetical protein